MNMRIAPDAMQEMTNSMLFQQAQPFVETGQGIPNHLAKEMYRRIGLIAEEERKAEKAAGAQRTAEQRRLAELEAENETLRAQAREREAPPAPAEQVNGHRFDSLDGG